MAIRHPGWLERALVLLEAAIFARGEDEGPFLTDAGRDRVANVLKAFDENTFNRGFDAAIRATTPPAVLRHVKFTHPQYLRDRGAAYAAFRKDGA